MNVKNFIIGAVATSMLFVTGCKKEETEPAGGGGVEFLASKDVMNKNAVLEEYTGIACGYCPDGHKIADNLKAQHGDRLVVVNIHAGGYAGPFSDGPNFTTAYGDNYVTAANVAGFPSGSVNRVGDAMSRSLWGSKVSGVLNEVSPVNIGAKATYNQSTKELTVKVDVYYTGDGNGANKLNIAFLQDNLVGRQVDYAASPTLVEDYVHNKVMRDMITGQWGDEISADKTKPGSEYSKTFTYSVPDFYNGGTDLLAGEGGAVVIQDCKLAIYIAQNNSNIYTGINVPVSVE